MAEDEREKELKKTLGVDYQRFTDAERKCISDKISKLVDEGKPQDQAIAIAIQQ